MVPHAERRAERTRTRTGHRFLRNAARFGKPFLANRKGTPSKFVECLLIDNVGRVNPLGSACCFYHAGFRFLQNVILQMSMRQCNHEVQPNMGWQCQRCFTLQPGGDADCDDEPEEAFKCELCGAERPIDATCSSEADMSGLADASASCTSGSSSDLPGGSSDGVTHQPQ
jgi:hypothetical protein